MAGSTQLVDYPTTPGALQAKFAPVFICYGLCQISFRAVNQYLTKLDPAGAKLIYSTAIAGGGQTTNTGLAVDAAGNAYVSGLADEGFPYTVKPPIAPQEQPFLVKIDPRREDTFCGRGGRARSSGWGQWGRVCRRLIKQRQFLDTREYSVSLAAAGASESAGAMSEQQRRHHISQAYVSRVDGATGDVLGTVLAVI